MLETVIALAVAAAPFPAPRVAALTDRLKSDAGTVMLVDARELRVMMAAGIVTFQVGPGVPVLDAAGHRLASPGALAAGQAVRVWYVVEDGARAVEVAAE